VSGVLLKLAGLFATLSLLAFGSGNSVLPDMQRAVVVTFGWMSDREFLELFAISRISPGPGSLIVALVGQRVAGLSGAAVATAAMFGPSCLLVHVAAGMWQRTREAAWRQRVEQGLAPVAVGLIFAAGFALIRGTEHSAAAYAVTGVATAVFAFTRLHPMIVLAGAGLAGLLLSL
jgi:chromate transporter